MAFTIKTAEQRQREYEREGLRSWEIAEREAEYRRRAQVENLIDMGLEHGSPTTTPQGYEEYTDVQGVKRAYTRGGDLASITLPEYVSNRYSKLLGGTLTPTGGLVSPLSPEGQLKRQYALRHAIASGNEAELRNIMDSENYSTMYSPHDQKLIERLYNARSQYAVDEELTEGERQSALDMIDAKISRVPRLSPMMQQPSPQQVFEKSIVTDPVTGQRGFFDPKSGKFNSINAEVNNKQRDLWLKQYNANTRLFDTDIHEPNEIVRLATEMTNRQLGPLEPTEQQLSPEEDVLFGLRRGEGRVTVDGKTLSTYHGQQMPGIIEKSQRPPKPIISVLDKLSEQEKRHIQTLIENNETQIIVQKNGKKYSLPLAELEEAIREGYSVVIQ